MNETEFCYWLNGYFEISQEKKWLDPLQVTIIRDHLAQVFNKKTPCNTKLPLEESPFFSEELIMDQTRPLMGTGIVPISEFHLGELNKFHHSETLGPSFGKNTKVC